MKEATGELSTTVITVVAIAAVATLFYTLVWPAIQKSIVDNTCSIYGENAKAINRDEGTTDPGTDLTSASARDRKYCCSLDGSTCLN